MATGLIRTKRKNTGVKGFIDRLPRATRTPNNVIKVTPGRKARKRRSKRGA